MKALPVLALAVVVIGFMWYVNRPTSPDEPPVTTTPPSASGTESGVAAVEPRTVRVLPQTTPDKLPPPLPTAPAITESDAKIDAALRANPGNSDADHLATAQMLINLLPTLPAEGQAEAAQHISNLLPDKEYNRLRPLVLNATAPREMLDVFVTDLMNRDDAVKLPVLLEIAKIPNHPTQEEALTDLQIFLDADHGADWGKWNETLVAYLKKQKEEDAEAAKVGK